jgi:hypothetical protein
MKGLDSELSAELLDLRTAVRQVLRDVVAPRAREIANATAIERP